MSERRRPCFIATISIDYENGNTYRMTEIDMKEFRDEYVIELMAFKSLIGKDLSEYETEDGKITVDLDGQAVTLFTYIKPFDVDKTFSHLGKIQKIVSVGLTYVDTDNDRYPEDIDEFYGDLKTTKESPKDDEYLKSILEGMQTPLEDCILGVDVCYGVSEEDFEKNLIEHLRMLSEGSKIVMDTLPQNSDMKEGE